MSHIVARAPNGQDPLSPSNSGALAEAAAAFPITPPTEGAAGDSCPAAAGTAEPSSVEVVAAAAKAGPGPASPRSPLSERAAGADSAGDLASLSEGSKPGATAAAVAGAALPAADQPQPPSPQLPQQRPQPPPPVAVPGAAPSGRSADPPAAASASPFSAAAAQQRSVPPHVSVAGAAPPPAPMAVPGRPPAGTLFTLTFWVLHHSSRRLMKALAVSQLAGVTAVACLLHVSRCARATEHRRGFLHLLAGSNSGPHSYSPNEYLLDDCSDEEFAADVEKLTLHEPVCRSARA